MYDLLTRAEKKGDPKRWAATELRMRLGYDWIWRRGGSSEGLQLDYLLP